MAEKNELQHSLRALIGESYVLTEEQDMAGYRHDGRGAAGGVPLAVVRPDSAQAISALVRWAADHDVRIVPQGGATGLVAGGVAGEGGEDVLLSLDRLTRYIEIDPVNRTATVDAGVRLSVLNAAAAEHGLFFPIDLGADPTIGGMVAANTGGARLLRYGDVRSNLMAMDMVRANADGTCLSLGGPLWKNNVGLDLKQLLVGAGGTTGIITRVTVALQRLPDARMTALVALNDPHKALPLLLDMEKALGAWLSAYEGMSQIAMIAAFAHVPGLRMPFAEIPPYAVLIELSAGGAFDESMMEDRLAAVLGPMMEGEGAPVLDVATDQHDGLWAIRHAVPEGLRAKGYVVGCDIAMRRGDVMRFRDDLADRISRDAPGFVPHDFGHIGDGGLHYNLVWDIAQGVPDFAAVEAARHIVFDAVVQDYGGSFSAEHGIGPRNIAYYRKYVPEAIQALAGRIEKNMAPVASGRVSFGLMEE
ncbi:MAG: FAD-binding oxidoreductase [Sphingobium sp.]|nr:FAD-binding oxidoreductase [Sphingobium sp.]